MCERVCGHESTCCSRGRATCKTLRNTHHAPDDVHQPLAVRLSSAHKEYGVFPNVWRPFERCRKASSFLAALQGGADKDDHHMDEGSLQNA